MMSSSLVSCTIGSGLKEECHKKNYCNTTGLLAVASLSEENRVLLKFRSGIEMNEEDCVCLHHEKCYLSHYIKLQKYCCDPFGTHAKKKITSKFSSFIVVFFITNVMIYILI